MVRKTAYCEKVLWRSHPTRLPEDRISRETIVAINATRARACVLRHARGGWVNTYTHTHTHTHTCMYIDISLTWSYTFSLPFHLWSRCIFLFFWMIDFPLMGVVCLINYLWQIHPSKNNTYQLVTITITPPPEATRSRDCQIHIKIYELIGVWAILDWNTIKDAK